MAEYRPQRPLDGYAAQLPDREERERVQQALHDAEHLPADEQTICEIEQRYGDDQGSVDVEAYVRHAFSTEKADTEFESLMLAAKILQIRLAFKQVDTPEGPRFVRIDKLQ